MEPKLTMTISEAAEATGLHENTLRAMVRAGKLPHLKLGGLRRVLIPRRAVLDLCDGAAKPGASSG